MAERETSRDIDQAASKWAARMDRGPLTPPEEEALEAWLSGDPRSKGALLRAQALWLRSESAQVLGPDFDPEPFEQSEPAPRPGMSRRRALAWAGGGAVTAASLTVLAITMPASASVVSTERGEIRLVPLKDGSTIFLNTDSRVRVRIDEDTRYVSLLEGEVYFSVARDEKRRPFIVEVNGRRLRIEQAGFRVRKLAAAPVDILVDRGRVDLGARQSGGTGEPVVLGANTRLLLSREREQPQRIAPEVVTRELAWREGKLAFEGETLGQAADSFARYSDTRIHIRDGSLANETVTGLFAANDPVGFGRAVARAFDAKVEQDGQDIVLTRGPVLQ
jgi:transmembrane sensor